MRTLLAGVGRRIRRFTRGQGLVIPASVSGLNESHSTVVALDYPKHNLRLMVSSDMERKWRARACAKEPWTVAWLEAWLPRGGVLFDIGANVGAFSLIGAKLAGSKGTVVAFEPGYASFAHLCSNIVLNGCQGSIIPVPLALSSSNGLSGFEYRSLDPGQSRHHFHEGVWTPAQAISAEHYVQPVLSMALDDAVSTFKLPTPNYIKLDVDGEELAVLRGASGVLESPALRSVLIEIDHTLSEPVSALLAAKGFTLDQKHDSGRGDATRVWYGVFTRAGSHT